MDWQLVEPGSRAALLKTGTVLFREVDELRGQCCRAWGFPVPEPPLTGSQQISSWSGMQPNCSQQDGQSLLAEFVQQADSHPVSPEPPVLAETSDLKPSFSPGMC